MANGSFWTCIAPRALIVWFATVLLTAQIGVASLIDGDHVVPEYATKYAPLVWLHSEDPFKPSDILDHIRHMTPRIRFEPIQGLPELTLDNLDILNQYGEDVALTSFDDVTKVPDWIKGEDPDENGKIHYSTPCCVILVENSPRDVDVFYFYFYSYDRGGNISQVLEPLDSLFDMNETQRKMHYGDHVGDWENNMIRFKDGQPVGIYYSQHTSGEANNWDDTAVEKVDGRPVVYSAYGSHANYARTGNHVHDSAMIDYCEAGPRWDPVQSAYFYHLDPSNFKLTRLFLPTDTDKTSNYTAFLYFTGKWGDWRYPDSDPRQEIVPYFKLPRFSTGPTGPLSKQLIRKGLFPDHGHVRSWMEWGVGVYMSWYPCCLKGWRIWVSGAVLFGLLAGAIAVIVYGVRKYKRRGYRRLDTEIPLQDMFNRDSNDSDLDRP